MANPTRLTKLGLSGGSQSKTNINDPFLQIVEFPVDFVASSAAQVIDVKTPSLSMQPIAAYFQVVTPESSAAATTVSVGVTGTTLGDVILKDVDVSAAGAIGTAEAAAFSTTAATTFTFTLAGNDFAELKAVCVVHYIGIDE